MWRAFDDKGDFGDAMLFNVQATALYVAWAPRMSQIIQMNHRL
jgi:hypothetical protein